MKPTVSGGARHDHRWLGLARTLPAVKEYAQHGALTDTRGSVLPAEEGAMKVGGNEYNLQELAGAFGDLGTLIPFLVGYITISHLDPVGVLVGFGLFKIIVGLSFKTPVPIQPMKAIGTAAISHPTTITAGAIWASGLFSGVIWLLMGMTGAVTWIAKITSRPLVQGLVLGLGLGFIVEGVKMMEANVVLAVSASALTFVLLSYERIPAMLVLLGWVSSRPSPGNLAS
jgi:hypothetical protein